MEPEPEEEIPPSSSSLSKELASQLRLPRLQPATMSAAAGPTKPRKPARSQSQTTATRANRVDVIETWVDVWDAARPCDKGTSNRVARDFDAEGLLEQTARPSLPNVSAHRSRSQSSVMSSSRTGAQDSWEQQTRSVLAELVALGRKPSSASSVGSTSHTNLGSYRSSQAVRPLPSVPSAAPAAPTCPWPSVSRAAASPTPPQRGQRKPMPSVSLPALATGRMSVADMDREIKEDEAELERILRARNRKARQEIEALRRENAVLAKMKQATDTGKALQQENARIRAKLRKMSAGTKLPGLAKTNRTLDR